MQKISDSQLYVRRVLREVYLHPEDRMIENKIKTEVTELYEHALKTDTLHELPNPHRLGLKYRFAFHDSALKADGFTPFFVRRMMRNFFGPVLGLLCVFIVFRLYPQTLRTALVTCAIGGLVAGIQQHFTFCKLRYMIYTLIVPSFLLLWYPLKNMLNSDGPINELNMGMTRAVISCLFFWQLSFIFVTLILHTFSYCVNPKKPVAIVTGSVLCIVMLTVFFLITGSHTAKLNQSAKSELINISNTWTAYINTKEIEELQKTFQTTDDFCASDIYLYEKLNCKYRARFENYGNMIALYHDALEQQNVNILFSELFGSDYQQAETTDATKIIQHALESAIEDFTVAATEATEAGTYKALLQFSVTAEKINNTLYNTAETVFQNSI